MNTMIRVLLVLAVLLSACALPAAAQDQNWQASSFFDVWCEPPGTVGGPVQVNAKGGSKTVEAVSGVKRLYDMNLPGNSTMGSFILRESPTRQSLGRAWTPIPGDPDFDLLRVHSFFDVFLELDIAGVHLYNTSPAHFYGESNSFSDITYHLDQDVLLYGVDGHVSTLKSGSTLNMTSVPEPSSLIALGALMTPLLAFRRRKS